AAAERPAFDDIAREASANGLMWLSRLATGFSLALRRNRSRHDLAEILEPYESRGDAWAAALIALVATFVDVREGQSQVAELSAVGLRFLERTSVQLTAGSVETIPLQIRNDSDIVEGYRFEVLGAPSAWTTIEP